jgi:hypothetical protein
MSTRSSKLSELPVANSVGANDILYIVQNGNSYQISANSLGILALGGLSWTPSSNADEMFNGTWDANVNYVINDLVIFNAANSVYGNNEFGSNASSYCGLYVAVANNTNTNPIDNQFGGDAYAWDFLAMVQLPDIPEIPANEFDSTNLNANVIITTANGMTEIQSSNVTFFNWVVDEAFVLIIGSVVLLNNANTPVTGQLFLEIPNYLNYSNCIAMFTVQANSYETVQLIGSAISNTSNEFTYILSMQVLTTNSSLTVLGSDSSGQIYTQLQSWAQSPSYGSAQLSLVIAGPGA